MYFLYVDEAGDVGLTNSPTRYFVLSGVVFHELRWSAHLDRLVQLRTRLRISTSLKLREEVHAGHMISKPGKLGRIAKHVRLRIIRDVADELVSMGDVTIINVAVDKAGKAPGYDVFQMAWKALLQRFENTLTWHNFAGPRNADDMGIVIPDYTHTARLRALIRTMRRYNPVSHQPHYGPGYRDLRIRYIVEDPNFRNSKDSYFVQLADVASFLLYQYLEPNRFMRKKGARGYLLRLEPILCKVCNHKDPLGIVRL
jgi:hypothetical protein